MCCLSSRFRLYLLLVVDGPRVLAVRTLVKHRLSLVDTAQLHRVVSHGLVATLDARLVDRRPGRLAGLFQRRLLFVGLGPQRRGPVGRVGDGGGQVVSHVLEVGFVGTNVAGNVARLVHLEGGAASGTKGPSHGECVWCR